MARARDIIVRAILGKPVTEGERQAAAEWIASGRRGGESRPFNLRAALLKRGVTPRELSERVGVSGRTVRHWIRGERRPTKENAVRIADALKFPRLRVVTGLAGWRRRNHSTARPYRPLEPLTGTNLAAARLKLGMTQVEVARLAGGTVTTTHVSRLERGKSSFKLKEVQAVIRSRLGKTSGR